MKISILFALALAACGTPLAPTDAALDVGADVTARVCVPGASIGCTCTDGRVGAQVCDSTGTGLQACVCGDVDAGSDVQVPGMDAQAGADASDVGTDTAAPDVADDTTCGGIPCPAPFVCVAGVCDYPDASATDSGSCLPPRYLCDGFTCVDVMGSDPLNCGACGRHCAAFESCCSGHCAYLLTDNNNCGACGNACASPFSCSSSACICHFPSGDYAECMGTCSSVPISNSNCGTCGNACPPGQNCVTGGGHAGYWCH